MSYKTTDGLMRHLRSSGIPISGSTQKRQLINTGYYHGYKGYRFFKTAGNRIPFSSYQELYATIQYDSALKALFYGKMMFIETAVKNIALQGILENADSENIQEILDRVVSSYNNSPASFTTDQKKRAQQRQKRSESLHVPSNARSVARRHSYFQKYFSTELRFCKDRAFRRSELDGEGRMCYGNVIVSIEGIDEP